MEIRLYPPLELSELIDEDRVKDPKRGSIKMVLWILTQYYKNRLSLDDYEILNERYLIPSKVSREINRLKDEERIRKKDPQTIRLRELKEEIANGEKELKVCEQQKNDRRVTYWKAQLHDLKIRLKVETETQSEKDKKEK